MLVKTQAFVLKNRKYGETDSLLTLFTRKLGKVNAIAKGARRPKSHFLAGIQPFCYSDFVLYKGKSLYTVSQCDSKMIFYGVREDLDKLAYGSYLLELIEAVTNEGQTNNRLFQLLGTSLVQLTEENTQIQTIIRAFELKLLAFSGIRPQLGACVNCGTQSSHVGFSIEEGGVLCANCYPLMSHKMKVSQTALRLAQYLLHKEMSETSKMKVNTKLMQELTALIKQYMTYHLGLKPSKSLEMMEKL